MIKDVSVITVTHQSKDCIADQILSVAISALKVEYEQIIVDNASTDGTAEWIASGYGGYVRLIANRRNVGFAKANNQGLAEATGRYLLFLNPDMRMELGGLDKLVDWMDAHPEAGIAGCKLLDREGSPHEALEPRRFPPCKFNLAFFLRLQRFFPSLKSQFQYIPFDPEKEQAVDSVRGAFMLVRREVIERLGRAFDPRFFILFEDLDFCKGVRGLGYQIIYTPQISCVDLFHRSFLHHSRAWKHVQMSRSLWVYAKKWYPLHERLALFLAIGVGFILRLPGWVMKWKKSFHKRENSCC